MPLMVYDKYSHHLQKHISLVCHYYHICLGCSAYIHMSVILYLDY